MSTFTINSRSFPAFSGLDTLVNKRQYVCTAQRGAIPLGRYYIVDRESGGRLGWLWDMFSGGKDRWFALYADDGKIDDKTFCQNVQRGEFRLHPKGPAGISKGCITIEKQSDFNIIYGILKASGKVKIPGTDIYTYGIVTVR
ncbi:DUF2778 domain-containing protein [Neisseriaceae bacterium TC5R-5]|nr:DUF2778 domain-containing protein [Neisseriaceae bacterium TC5R-5]